MDTCDGLNYVDNSTSYAVPCNELEKALADVVGALQKDRFDMFVILDHVEFNRGNRKSYSRLFNHNKG